MAQSDMRIASYELGNPVARGKQYLMSGLVRDLSLIDTTTHAQYPIHQNGTQTDQMAARRKGLTCRNTNHLFLESLSLSDPVLILQRGVDFGHGQWARSDCRGLGVYPVLTFRCGDLRPRVRHEFLAPGRNPHQPIEIRRPLSVEYGFTRRLQNRCSGDHPYFLVIFRDPDHTYLFRPQSLVLL